MRQKKTISSILAIAPFIISFCSCEKAASGPASPVPVRTASVESIRIGNPVKYSATIVPYSQVDLSFKSSGYVDRVLQVKGVDGRTRAVDQGDWVKKGTVLAVVQEQDYRDKLQQAQSQLLRSQAEYDKAKTSFDRTNALYASKSATKPDYDSAKAQLDSTIASVDAAKAQISEAQVALDYCSLRAPFDAWVVKRSVDVGSLVGPATNGFTIADTRTVRVVFGVPDIAIAGVKLGDRMAITTDALPGVFYGRVTTISPAADPKSRVYSVEVAIDNARNQLKSGMIATLSLGSEDLSRPVTVVPLEAVIRDPRQADAYAVMVTEGAGDSAVARLRPVELGNAYGNKIGIVKGLAVNQRVITAGVTMLRDGEAVRVVP